MFALDRLTIGRFRGLQDLTLDDLGRVNLLVGPNNSGKTSILEAVSVFCRPLDLRTWLDATWRREASDLGDPFFLSVEWMFPHWRPVEVPFVRGEVDISGVGNYPTRELRAVFEPTSRIRARPPISSGHPDPADKNGYEQAGARVQIAARADIERGAPLSRFSRSYDLWEGEALQLSGHDLESPVKTITPVSHRVEPIPELSEAALGGQKAQVLSLLRKLDPLIRDVLILSPGRTRPAIYIDYAPSGLLPLSSFGDGIRRAFLVALVLNSLASGVLLIDEIESSLHVTALRIALFLAGQKLRRTRRPALRDHAQP